MANMSAKFDQEAHNGLVSIVFTSLFPYMSIVTLTFDLWPPKSIASILSPWLTCLPSLIKKYTMVQFLSYSQAYFHICPLCLDLWPLTSKINRVHPLIMVNMSAKFDKETCNGVVSIVFTRSTDGRTDRRTHTHTEPQQRYYIPTATHCAGIINTSSLGGIRVIGILFYEVWL